MPIADRLRGWARFLIRPAGQPPRPTRRNQIFDAVLALVFAVVAIRYGLTDSDSPVLIVENGGPLSPDPPTPGMDADGRADAAVAATVAASALVFRRRYPLSALWVVVGTTVLVASNEPRLTFYACVVAAYSAAAYSQYRVPALVSAAFTVVAVTMDMDAGIPVVDTEFIPLLVLAPIVVAADGLRRWKLRIDASHARLSEMERERADAVRRAAEDERARIARDLHDVVTHNVSVMVIQAGAARRVMATEPDRATDALLAVESGGRAAMAELRQVMGLLRADGDGDRPGGDVQLSPQPGLDQLESLVARVREAGLRVELVVAGDVRALPLGIELAAYRVVQEALTNTVKHASGASATVSVEYGADQLRVEAVDTGGASVESAASVGGRGLIGLRERLAIYGGTLRAGPRLTGGYRVEALIPVEVS